MSAWTGPFVIAALLLAAAGALKVREPAHTVGALRALGWRVPPGAVRAGGAVELGIGTWAIVTGAAAPAVLVAASYVVFSAFVVIALRARSPLGSCGCFGRVDTPPSGLHLVVNGAAIVVAVVVALGHGSGLATIVADQPWFGIPFFVFAALGTYLAFLVLTALPQLQRAARTAAGA